MRKLLLSSALFILAFSAQAGQDDLSANVTGAPVVGGLFPHFGLGANAGAAEPQSHRLIAKVFLNYADAGFRLVDSTTYAYSNSRGSVPNEEDINNDNHILFDISTTYLFDPVSAAYQNNKQRIQEFTSANKVSELVYKKWHPVSSTWKNQERYIYTYDNNGKMYSSVLQLWYGTLWTNDINSVLHYDNNNNVVNMNSPTYTIDFVYDQDNNLVMIEDQVWGVGGWTKNERKTYSYVGDDVSQYVLAKWVNGAWANTSKWEYTYDSKSNVVLSTEYSWGSSGWAQVRQEEFVYDTNGNMLRSVEKTWDAGAGVFVNNKMEQRVYNIDSLLEKVITYTWNGNTWAHTNDDIEVRYYYEIYFPTSVRNIASGADLKLFPMPANDILHVALGGIVSGDVTVTIVDMSGKVVYRQPAQLSGNNSLSIPLHNLPAGNYALTAAWQDASVSRPIAVVH